MIFKLFLEMFDHKDRVDDMSYIGQWRPQSHLSYDYA